MTMTILSRPKVTLIAHTVPVDGAIESVKNTDSLSFDESVGAKIVESAGRICYDSFLPPHSQSGSQYLQKLIKLGHGSVLEHVVYTFLVICSRATSHEIIRHRAGCSYSERSLRWCEPIGIMLPEDEEAHDDVKNVYRDAVKRYIRVVEKLLHKVYEGKLSKEKPRKWANGIARYLLPLCTLTELVVTMNARAVRNFLEQRGSKEADWEIRQVALAIYEIVKHVSPWLVFDFTYTSNGERDGFLTCEHHKV